MVVLKSILVDHKLTEAYFTCTFTECSLRPHFVNPDYRRAKVMNLLEKLKVHLHNKIPSKKSITNGETIFPANELVPFLEKTTSDFMLSLGSLKVRREVKISTRSLRGSWSTSKLGERYLHRKHEPHTSYTFQQIQNLFKIEDNLISFEVSRFLNGSQYARLTAGKSLEITPVWIMPKQKFQQLPAKKGITVLGIEWDPVEFPIPKDIRNRLSEREEFIIENYGFRLSALQEKRMEPKSESGVNFVNSANGLKKPETEIEAAWLRFLKAKDY